MTVKELFDEYFLMPNAEQATELHITDIKERYNPLMSNLKEGTVRKSINDNNLIDTATLIVDRWTYNQYAFEIWCHTDKNKSKKYDYDTIRENIPDDAEHDRFWSNDSEITAVYYNPNGGGNEEDGEIGEFMEHHFPIDYIIENDGKYPHTEEGDNEFCDALYGDAQRCPTYCIDIGTKSFENTIANWSNGTRLKNETPNTIRSYLTQICYKSKRE